MESDRADGGVRTYFHSVVRTPCLSLGNSQTSLPVPTVLARLSCCHDRFSVPPSAQHTPASFQKTGRVCGGGKSMFYFARAILASPPRNPPAADEVIQTYANAHEQRVHARSPSSSPSPQPSSSRPARTGVVATEIRCSGHVCVGDLQSVR